MSFEEKSREELRAEIDGLKEKIQGFEEIRLAAKREKEELEERYQALFQSRNAIRFISDMSNGNIIDANQAACDFYGYSKEELLSKKTWEINTLPRSELLGLLESIRHREKTSFQFQHRLKSGEIRDVEVFTAPYDRNGETFLFSIVNDITERKRSETELREREARLRVIFETSHAGIIMVDPRGKINFANKRMSEMFNCSMEALIGSPYSDFLHPFSRQNCIPVIHRMISGEQDYVAMEKQYLRCNGGSFWGYLSAGRLEAEDKSLIALVLVITDITDLKKAEEALQESEERYRRLVELCPEAIYIHSDGRLVFSNRMGATLLGAESPEELYGRLMLDFVHGDYREIARQYNENIIRHREAVSMTEQLFVRIDGSCVPVEVAGISFSFRGSDAVQIVARDISERKKMQDEMLKTQKLESLGILAGGIAHDFNNILTTILGNLSLIRMQVDPGHVITRRLAECEKATTRASNLTQQLLTFSRGGEPVKKVVAPASIIEDAASFVLHGSSVKSIIKLADELWCLNADSGQFTQALHNLLINAMQAMPGGGEVKIHAANETIGPGNPYQLAPGIYLRIDVEDEG